jgi:glycerate kinase
MSFCGAKVQSGFDLLAETVGLEAKIKEADLVITGEGRLDAQTLEGKGSRRSCPIGAKTWQTRAGFRGRNRRRRRESF